MSRSAKEKVFDRDFDAAIIAESKGDYYAMRLWIIRAAACQRGSTSYSLMRHGEALYPAID